MNDTKNPAPNPFQLIATYASQLRLDLIGDVVPGMKFDFAVNDQISRIEQDQAKDRVFAVTFRVNIHTNPAILTLQTTFHVLFQCEQIITSDFLESPMINVNAKAIAFPFVRSFINTVTSNAGLPPLVLPALNFVKRQQEEKVITPEVKGENS